MRACRFCQVTGKVPLRRLLERSTSVSAVKVLHEAGTVPENLQEGYCLLCQAWGNIGAHQIW